MFKSESGSLLAELQAVGLGDDAAPPLLERRGGAGPSDHRALSLGETTLMVPMRGAGRSPFRLRVLPSAETNGARAFLLRDDVPIAEVALPGAPRFYALATADGIPYPKIALLHARRVLASTVMQSCVRYNDAARACRFCAIGSSLAAGRTIGRKTPAQLAEVAAAAVRLDGVEQLVLTTGTPATPDRLRDAGADTLGMHLEAVEPAVRAAVMPGKAEVPVERYLEAYAAAVAVFGRGQVSTYLIAGLGDRPESLIEMARTLAALGVYPFLVPFVPIAETPMADAPAPSAATMERLYRAVGRIVRESGVTSAGMKAGCGKCGACSALSSYEVAS